MTAPLRSLAKGRLAVIGGRLEDDNAAIYDGIRDLSGGRILVFPTASGEPEEVGQEQVAVFRAHGFDAELVDLTVDTAGWMAHDPATLDRVAEFGSVYFTGGDQAQIVAALAPGGVETPLLAEIRAAQAAGGLVAGSSAGAAMMSQPMILGGTSLEAVVHGVTEDPDDPGLLLGSGLGFFPYGMVDQHFIKRGRIGRLMVAMRAARIPVGFGVDENTALLIDGTMGRVCGEFGVMVIDARAVRAGYEGLRLSYLDHGDAIDLSRLRAMPGADKRRVAQRDIAYRAPGSARRNVFGAYAVYDLMTRIVLGDPEVYTVDQGEAFDARSGVNVTLELERVRGRTGCFIATPESGLRMTGTRFRLSLRSEGLRQPRRADRITRCLDDLGGPPPGGVRLALLGSSPLGAGGGEMLSGLRDLVGQGQVGVLAAASAAPRHTAQDHVAALTAAGFDAVDLGVTIDTVGYASRDPALLDRIAGLGAIFICGGNQIRLVDTLLHRGEESAVLHALMRAQAAGAVLIAASGAASALPSVMIAGGTTGEALRYGVTSDLGHPGLVMQEGLGLFAGGIVDQNLIDGGRLGRLIVACAEEHERFGIGICEESTVVAGDAGLRLAARGRHGFVLVEVDPANISLRGDRFTAAGVRLIWVRPGDSVDLAAGPEVVRGEEAPPEQLLTDLLGAFIRHEDDRRGVEIRLREQDALSAVLDLSFMRDECD